MSTNKEGNKEVAALRVEGLTAGYGGPPIIDQVSLTARRGDITAIVGPNGAGKSTLLKAVAGLVRTTAGKVFVEGKDVTGQPTEKLVRRGIAYVPQVENVFPDLTVREISIWAAISSSPASMRGSRNYSASFLISRRQLTGMPAR